jgi:hypothetical protein
MGQESHGLLGLVARAPRALLPERADRETFENPDRLTELGTAAFENWAGGLAFVPRPARQFITGVSADFENLALLTTEIEGRRAHWKETPYHGTARVHIQPMSAVTVELWSHDERSLREASDYVAVCDTCQGSGSYRCGQCSGSGSFICRNCGGTGKAYSHASNGSYRLMNCKICLKRGRVSCPHCHNGIATCATCGGGRRLQRWLELEKWHRVEGAAHPPATASALGWPNVPDDETVRMDSFPLGQAQAPRALAGRDLGNIPVESLQLVASAQPAPSGEERIIAQRLRVVAVPRLRIEYAAGRHRGAVDLYGRRLVAGPAGGLSYFARRSQFLRRTAIVLLSVFSSAALIYFARSPFYRNALGVLTFALLGGALGAAFKCLIEVTGAGRGVSRWATAAVATVLAAGLCGFLARPTIRGAETSIAAGDLGDAEVELRALSDDMRLPETREAWANLRVARLKAASDLHSALAEVRQIPEELPQHARAVELADSLAAREVAAGLNRESISDALGAYRSASDGWRESASGKQAAAKLMPAVAEAAMAKNDWSAAATAIAEGRSLSVAQEQLQVLTRKIRDEATTRARQAGTVAKATDRLRSRIEAERLWRAWERATGQANTAALLELRTSMASDLRRSEGESTHTRR